MTKYMLTGKEIKAEKLRKGHIISVMGTRFARPDVIMEIVKAYGKVGVRLDNGDVASYDAIKMILLYEPKR